MDDQGELDTKDGMLKIIFYTNDVCPWAHRVAILLKELDLPFKKKIIDLSAPRPKAFLELNPVTNRSRLRAIRPLRRAEYR